jgi:hypothetical protein
MPDPIDYSGRLKDLLQEPYANSPELRSIYRDVGKGLATSGNKFVDITQRLGNLLGLGAIQDIEGSIDFFKQSQSKDVGKLLGELLQSGSQLVPPGRFARGLRQAGLPTINRVLEGEGRAVGGYLPKDAKEAALRELFRDFPISAESPVELDFVRDLAEHFLLRKDAVNRPPSSPFQVRDIPELTEEEKANIQTPWLERDRQGPPLAEVIDFPGKKSGEPTAAEVVRAKYNEIAARRARKEDLKDPLDKALDDALDQLGGMLDPIRWTGSQGRIRSRDEVIKAFTDPDTEVFDGSMWFEDKNYSLELPGEADEHLWVTHKDNPGQPIGRITALDDRRFELHAVLEKGGLEGMEVKDVKVAELGMADTIHEAIKKIETRLKMMPKK